MEVRKLKPDEFYDLRDLLEDVFTKHNNRKSDFAKAFPRIFGSKNEYATKSHYGAFTDGKLVGTAAMYPLDYVVGGEHIRLIANGNVAVDENYRGCGVMSALLAKINEECDKCADICYLHGDAVRYGRYGYYGGEIKYNLTFEPGDTQEFTFRPMEDTDVPALQKMSEKRTDFIKRQRDEFIPALKSGRREALSVFDKNRNLVGYISFNEGMCHVEEFAFNGEIEVEVFGALAKTVSASVSVLISGYDKKTAKRLEKSGVKAELIKDTSTLFRVINPQRMKDVARLLDLDQNTLFAPYLT